MKTGGPSFRALPHMVFASRELRIFVAAVFFLAVVLVVDFLTAVFFTFGVEAAADFFTLEEAAFDLAWFLRRLPSWLFHLAGRSAT